MFTEWLYRHFWLTLAIVLLVFWVIIATALLW